jgi:hypothetical protein
VYRDLGGQCAEIDRWKISGAELSSPRKGSGQVKKLAPVHLSGVGCRRGCEDGSMTRTSSSVSSRSEKGEGWSGSGAGANEM